MRRVCLRDIAERAGVSVPTVSLAMRNCGRVSPQRAAEIRELAKSMGYQPNPILSALASSRFSRSKELAGTPIAIFTFPTLPGEAKAARNKYADALLTGSRELGYSPYEFDLPRRDAVPQMLRQLHARAAQGVLIIGSMDREFADAFDWSPFAVVQCARYRVQHPFHTVRPNVFQGIKLVFTTLRERGFQRIGFAFGRHPVMLEDDEDRYGTAMALEMTYVKRCNQIPPFTGDFKDGPSFLAWYRKHRPEVVVGFSVRQYWDLREAGVRIPDETGFVWLHRGAAKEDASISGLDQNQAEIARQSVALLDQLIRSNQKGIPELPLQVLIPATWKEGKTLRSAGDRPRFKPRPES